MPRESKDLAVRGLSRVTAQRQAEVPASFGHWLHQSRTNAVTAEDDMAAIGGSRDPEAQEAAGLDWPLLWPRDEAPALRVKTQLEIRASVPWQRMVHPVAGNCGINDWTKK